MEQFYENKKVFITGHTGFKGSWLCKILTGMGAKVWGYSLPPQTEPNLYTLIKIDSVIEQSFFGDIRHYENLEKAINMVQPDIVIHLAAQPIVRESYKNPRYTYETNVMGTVNILEAIRNCDTVKSFLNVTTDKVYDNKEISDYSYREDDKLDGYDPYSNSKSCSELVTHSYAKSFFDKTRTAISTARAGNVVGGGDFSVDRIIPDCVRAMENNSDIVIRNPYSTRPYQHVLEPLFAYLQIVQNQFENRNYQGYYNVGPDDCNCITAGELATLFCNAWGNNAKWVNQSEKDAVHEANFLKLDNNLLKTTFCWKPTWNIANTIEKVVEWSKIYLNGEDLIGVTEKQIKQFKENML